MKPLVNKTLLLDTEVSSNIGRFYDKPWEAKIIDITQYQYVMSISFKWVGRDKIYTYALPDFPNWKTDKFDDSALVRKLWEAINEADIVVAHNLKKFDIRKLNTRFIVNDFDPPRPYKMIDTLQIARAKFGFIGNSLNDLCKQLDIGQKKDKTHSDLWKACLNGDPVAWKHMRSYNAHDVRLLEGLYKRLLPWIEHYPIVATDNGTCRKCGGSHLVKRGFRYTTKGVAHSFQCVGCGSYSQGPISKDLWDSRK